MEFKINIGRKHLLYLVFLVAIVGGIGLVVGYGSNNPTIMGHSWSETTCFDCITQGNISTGAVASDEIADDTIMDVDIAVGANIAGSKINVQTLSGDAPNLNCNDSDTVDGKHASELGGSGLDLDEWIDGTHSCSVNVPWPGTTSTSCTFINELKELPNGGLVEVILNNFASSCSSDRVYCTAHAYLKVYAGETLKASAKCELRTKYGIIEYYYCTSSDNWFFPVPAGSTLKIKGTLTSRAGGLGDCCGPTVGSTSADITVNLYQ